MAVRRPFVGFGVYILLFCTITCVSGEETVEALSGDLDVSLTFDAAAVPDSVSLISIRLYSSTDVAYVYNNKDFSGRVLEKLKDRVTVKSDKPKRQISLHFNSVNTEDAGSYECFEGTTRTKKVKGCGSLLIIIHDVLGAKDFAKAADDLMSEVIVLVITQTEIAVLSEESCWEDVEDCPGQPNPPTVELSPESKTSVGENLVLRCQTQSLSLPPDHNLPSVVEWMIDDVPLGDGANDERISGDQFITYIRREDKGRTFKCRSADMTKDEKKRLMSEWSPEYVLIPEYGPTPDDVRLTPPIQNGSTHAVKFGSALQLSCSVACEPECSMSWDFKAHSSANFIPAPSQYTNGGSLQIASVLRSTHGQYRCVGTNKLGTVEYNFKLDVLYMLTPIPYFNDQEARVDEPIEEGQEVVLRCDFDSNPEPTVSWNAPDNRLLWPTTLEGPLKVTGEDNLLIHRYTSEVMLPDLKCSQSGPYECQGLTKEFGYRSNNITVRVKCRPRSVLEGPKRLKSEYVWEWDADLQVEFLVEAWPKPYVKKVESERDGILKREEMNSDISVLLQDNYGSEQYLTLVELRSIRKLTVSDDNGRTFIITLANSDYEVPFRFTIHPRGRPHKMSNITVDKVSYDSVQLSWIPGFDGGEKQTFSVYMKKQRQARSTDAESFSQQWIPLVGNISDSGLSEKRVTAKVDGLAPSTEYRLLIMGRNIMGNTTSEIVVKTLSAPASSMAGGAIAAIVIVIIIVIIVIAVLFYIFIYRKRWGKGGPWKPAVPSKVRAVYSRIKRHQNGRADGAKVAPKKKHLIYLGDDKTSNAIVIGNVPTESTDPTLLEEDHANANEISSPMLKEPIYSNTSPAVVPDTGDYSNTSPAVVPDTGDYSNTSSAMFLDTEDRGDNGTLKGEEDELQYTTLVFPNSKPKPRYKKKKDKSAKKANKEEEQVIYSDIDSARTKAKELEIQREEEDAKNPLQEEDNPYQDVNQGPGTAV